MDSEDSDQTPGADAQADLSLAGRTCHFVGFVMRHLITYLEVLQELL